MLKEDVTMTKFEASKYVKDELFVKIQKQMRVDDEIASKMIQHYLQLCYDFKSTTNSNHIRMKAAGYKLSLIDANADEIDVTSLYQKVFPTSKQSTTKVVKEVKFS